MINVFVRVMRRKVMSEKQTTIDYKSCCENYGKEVGCYNTFDGSCIKE